MEPGQYDEQDFDNASDLVKLRQRYFRRPKTPANIISQMMARQGYGQTKSNDELNEAWEIASGPRFAKNTKAGRINRGVLEVHVSSSAAMNMLSFEKKKLLSAMQQQLPQNNIKDLRFKLGNVAR
ncbi:DUF721 domain-containing protein [Mariniblastus fucicola]|uniref:DUF721 domain-containing protein n=1 Tax=Mariniblastus fucicola TaxID=980251 RepID=A0A5B9P685_9BACT|nr:DUF721 domain-containing protein [Mariniblastus fucicola]QEG20156.1 hypothetical protein MFFC18_00030 [Mariniblastus fucicola]